MGIDAYLNELIVQKQALVDALNAKGITASNGEKLNTLIPKLSGITTSARGINKPLYRFGVLSDIHITDTNFVTDGNFANTDYQKALQYMDANGAEFICIPGDIVASNHAADGSYSVELAEQEYIGELNLFMSLNNAHFPGKPVHLCTGNHDATALGYNNAPGGMGALLGSYQDGTKTVEQAWTEITGRQLNYVFEQGNDVFIFHSMYYWNYVNYCRDADIQWLASQLATYADRRVFLFFHLPLPGYFDGPSGEGGLILLAEGSGGRSRDFKNLVEQYPNVIWFNGHSHYDLELEATYDNPNTHITENGLVSIHCPSASYLRLPGSPYINVPEGSQGYVVDVYADSVIVQGVDFTVGTGVEIPIAKYVIAT